MRSLIVIPARFASSRLPGKPLVDILGKPMIQRVWEQCSQVLHADVVVATDDARIVAACAQFGAAVVMTSVTATCGTDRLAEVAQMPEYAGYDAYINVQGDEPMIRPADIEKAMALLNAASTADIVTLFHRITAEEARRPEAVKVALGADGRCLYFSRSAIPFDRDGQARDYFKHVGLYGFRRQALLEWLALPQGILENRESLEQLRLLEAGYTLYAAEVGVTGPGVDTPETLEEVRRLLQGLPATQGGLQDIRLIITDVDGVLTDNGLLGGPEGTQSKVFSTRDGLGFSLLRAAGIPVALLSGRRDAATERRAAELRVPAHRVLLAVHDKRTALQALIAAHGLLPSQCLYIGDDLIDLPAFAVVGHQAAPADAHPAVLQKASLKLKANGGQGAFREVAEKVLEAQGHGMALREADAFQALFSHANIMQ